MDIIRVLLVDDNSTFLDIAARFLAKQEDLDVVGMALGAEEALAVARDERPDVTLIDLAMPTMSGLEAIPLLRAAVPEMGIIALTLLASDSYRRAARSAGADGLVSKTTLKRDLVPAIRRLAADRRDELGALDSAGTGGNAENAGHEC